jgi:DNA-binding NtrC family response regulator
MDEGPGEWMAHILVIDDESILLDLISRTLRMEGHTVTAVSDPLAAIDSARTGTPPIDLLLTDVNMRPVSGPELVQRLTAAGFTAPVLFMSGYPTFASAFAGSRNACAVIDKPFTIGELRLVVARILESEVSS